MVVGDWYVNIHLYPPFLVPLSLVFYQVDPLKQEFQNEIVVNMKPLGCVSASLTQNNPFFLNESVFKGILLSVSHNVHEMSDLFFSPLPPEYETCPSVLDL